MTTMKRKLPSDYLKQGWCQDRYARNKNGDDVEVGNQDACLWCLYGAIYLSVGQGTLSVEELFHLQVWLNNHRYSSEWQDAPERTQEEVVAVMLEAEATVLGSTT